MSWLNAVLNTADLALTINATRKMGQMQQQAQALHEASQAHEFMQSVVREYIFRLSQVKEDILLHKRRNPIAVTAALFYLEAEVEDSGLSADMFTELSDKQYFADTLRGIRREKLELLDILTEDQRKLAQTTGQALMQFPEVRLLVQTFDDAQTINRLRHELQDLERTKPTGMFANRSTWSDQWNRTKQSHDAASQRVDLESWWELSTKHGRKTKVEYMQMMRHMEELIARVFGSVEVPHLSVGEVLSEKLETAQLPQRTGTASIPSSSDGRVACPNCGYRNSTYRKTCKSCRTQLS